MPDINVYQTNATDYDTPSLRLVEEDGVEYETIHVGEVRPQQASYARLNLINLGGNFRGLIRFYFENSDDVFSVHVEENPSGAFPIRVSIELFGHAVSMNDLRKHQSTLVVDCGGIQTIRQKVTGTIIPHR
ncbi:hypothetical protein HC928_06925 [bacterium]|nr:hypothetical protein [bacterium]